MEPGVLLNRAVEIGQQASLIEPNVITVKLKAVNAKGEVVPWQDFTAFQASVPQTDGRFKGTVELDERSFQRVCFDDDFRARLSDDHILEAASKLVRSRSFTGNQLRTLNLTIAGLLIVRHGVAIPSLWNGIKSPPIGVSVMRGGE